MITKIILPIIFSEFIHQVAIKYRFWKALQKKYYIKTLCQNAPYKFLKTPYEFYDIYTLVREVLLSKPYYEYWSHQHEWTLEQIE